jgi:hypothetical protein
VRGSSGSAHLGQQLVARLLAAPTRLGADAAVLHAVLSVLLALVATALAGLHECGDEVPAGIGVVLGLARHHVRGSRAAVRAVEVQPDALDEAGDVRFRKTCIRAGGAGMAAVRQRVERLTSRVASRLNERG